MSLKVTLVILAAGNSSRFQKKAAKQWLRTGDLPLWLFVARKLKGVYPFEKCVIATHRNDCSYMQGFIGEDEGIEIVVGGDERQASLKNAMESVTSEYVLVTDVARACIDKQMIERLLAEAGKYECVVPFLKVADTVLYRDEVIERDDVKRIQTPQLSRSIFLKEALNDTKLFTDESTLIKAHGGNVGYVEGDEHAAKLTYGSEIGQLTCLDAPTSDIFTGNGFDVHAFEAGRKMVLGGVEIASDFGFKAHSDGDVAIHALIDALLGAAGAGDIGELFPDTDAAYKDADSALLLEECVGRLCRYGYEIVNADITIIAQAPKIGPYKAKMKQRLAQVMGIEPFRLNIKATTTEKLGFVGRKEGVAVMATASLKYFNWTK